jgi:flavin-binding protein dodecin
VQLGETVHGPSLTAADSGPKKVLAIEFGGCPRDDRSGDIERRGAIMGDSVYRVTEVIGTSSESWEAAAANAVETAAQSVRDLRVAEATRFDVTIADGKIADYRVRLDISFKYDAGD